MYPPELVAPMKAELADAGFSELITVDDVNDALDKPGTTLVVINRSLWMFCRIYEACRYCRNAE